MTVTLSDMAQNNAEDDKKDADAAAAGAEGAEPNVVVVQMTGQVDVGLSLHWLFFEVFGIFV